MTRAAPGTPVPTREQRGGGTEPELYPPRYVSVVESSQADQPDVETAIVLQVTAALLIEPPTDLTLIEVDNQYGIVTLKGQVGSARLQTIAGEIASNHPGVERTVNALEIYARVEPEQEAEAEY